MTARYRFVFIAPALVLAMALLEFANGRGWLCPCGTIKLWDGVPNSPESSQHIADWYTLSHIIHGFLFFGLGWLLLRKMPLALRLAFATLIEAGWELLENSHWVIDRYRTTTVSVDYNGDSILNSTCDVLFMMLGFWIASRLPWKLTVVLAVAMELLALYVIRDNLTLNVIMLLWPLQAIRDWQAALPK